MNQQIIFNDDILFDKNKQGWVFSALLSGERLSILIKGKQNSSLTDKLKFDLEEMVEEWLDEHEPPTNSKIELDYK